MDSAPNARLSQFERLTLIGGDELQRALQWIVRQCASFSFSKQIDAVNVETIKKAVDFYTENKDWSENPSSFFVKPSEIPQVKSHLVHGLKDGSIIDLSFKSSYKVQNPDYIELYGEYKENQDVHARYWQHTEGAKATVIALHGWTMGDQRLNSLAFLPGLFYKAGFDVVLMELPFHGRRRPSQLVDADSIFPGSNPTITNEVIGQFISELRQLHMFLEKQGAKNIGCLGMSLGAYLGALWASLDKLEFCIPIVPIASISDLAWNALKSAPNFSQLKKDGLTKDLLEKGYALHCPLNYIPQTPSENIMILAGLADKIVPSTQPRMLWEHWNKPRMHWFRGGHLAQFKSQRALGRVVRFFQERGYL